MKNLAKKDEINKPPKKHFYVFFFQVFLAGFCGLVSCNPACIQPKPYPCLGKR